MLWGICGIFWKGEEDEGWMNIHLSRYLESNIARNRYRWLIIFQWSANKYCLKLLNLSKIQSNISFFRKQNKNVYLQRIFCWNGVYEINNLDSFCKSSFFEVTRNRLEILLYPAISSSGLFHRFALFSIRLSRSSLVEQRIFFHRKNVVSDLQTV